MDWSNLSLSEKSRLMRIYLENGISSLDDMKEHYNNYATGGSIEEKNEDDTTNFVGGATALKKDYDYALEHLADKYSITAEGPWHKYGIHNPSESQKAHWNELIRMRSRVASRPNYEYLNPTRLAEWTPIIGDTIDAGHSIYDLQQGNIGAGLAGLTLLAVPNFIEKPVKTLAKGLKTIKHNWRTNYDKLYKNVQDNFIQQYNKYPNMFNSNPANNPLPTVNKNPIKYYWNGPMDKKVNPKKWLFKEYKKIPMFSADGQNTIYIKPSAFTYPEDYFKSIATHEFTHPLQDLYSKRGTLGIRKNEKEVVANPFNPAYKYGLSEFEKLATPWRRSPLEFQADVNRIKYSLDIPLTTSYNNLTDSEKYYLKLLVNEKFKMPENVLNQNLETLSDGLYFNLGGQLNN